MHCAAAFQELEQWDVGHVTKTYETGGQRACPERSRRIALRRDGVLYYLHTDHLGSTSVLTNAGGQEVPGTRLKYYPYDGRGRVISETQTIAATAYTTLSSYDAADRLRTLTYPTG
ncbi:MAG: hypothetical protein FJ011_27935, partial [Chloroflexi bacterium]|nr:hypothetical protein [Chloroflexota bacterium]